VEIFVPRGTLTASFAQPGYQALGRLENGYDWLKYTRSEILQIDVPLLQWQWQPVPRGTFPRCAV